MLRHLATAFLRPGRAHLAATCVLVQLAASSHVAADASTSDAFLGTWGPSAVTQSGIVDGITAARHPLQLSYEVDLGDPAGGVTERFATFATTPTEDGNVYLRWSYSGFHAFFAAHATLVLWRQTDKGLVESVLFDDVVSGPFSATGFTAAIPLQSGQPWGLRVGGSNFDANSVLRGDLSLEAVYQNEPAIYDPNQWSSAGIDEGVTSISPDESALELGYVVDLGDSGFGVGWRSASYTLMPKADGELSFDWRLDCYHAFFLASAIVDVSIATPSGPVAANLLTTSPSGFTSAADTFTHAVYAGMPVTITLSGANADSDSELWGAFVLRNASLPIAVLAPCQRAEHWTVTHIDEGTSSIENVGSPVHGLEAAYSVDLSKIGHGVSEREATFTATSGGGATVTVDWTYTGFHAFFLAFAQLTFFTETGDFAALPPTGVSGTFAFAGSTQFDVLPGEAWGFRSGGSNFDTTSVLEGTVTLTHVALPACSGDLDCDGAIGGADLAIILGAWGRCSGCDADLDGDGDVDGADLAIILGGWGPCG